MQSFNIEGQYIPYRNKSHFILCPAWCAPHAPLCTFERARYASASPKHFSKTPSGVFLNNSFPIRKYDKARYFTFLSVSVEGSFKEFTIGLLQSVSAKESIFKTSNSSLLANPNCEFSRSPRESFVAIALPVT